MNTQRVGLMALRRAAIQRPVFFTQSIPRLALAATQSRPITTEKLSQTDASALLNEQRLKRPVAPHLTIYDPKQTFGTSSIWQRITGATLTGSLYLFSFAYLVAPLTGWHLESASLVAGLAAWPELAKGGLKLALAWPFTYHFYNGLRHLFWDATARGFGKAQLVTVARYVWAASLATALGLVAFL